MSFLLSFFVVWFLTGFWHGASWNFIVWGLYFVFFLLIEKMWLSPYLQKYRILSHVYVLFFVMISFVIFDAASLTEAVKSKKATDFSLLYGIKPISDPYGGSDEDYRKTIYDLNFACELLVKELEKGHQ